LSTIQARVSDKGLDLVVTATRIDLEPLVVIDTNHDGVVSPAEFVSALPKLEDLARRLLLVSADSRTLSPATPEVEMDKNMDVIIHLHFPVADGVEWRIRSPLLDRFPAGHKQYLEVENATGKMLGDAMLRAGHDTFEVGPSGPLSERGRSFSAGAFLLLGIEHILTGYDHLLFLFALLIMCKKFWDVVRIVTCFTIAHSITLALAALDIVNIPSQIIEPAIAASIVFVGVENLCHQPSPRSRGILTFAFGLIHGFGFASVLRELGVAQSAAGVAGPLVCFNLGVEIGQIAVAAVLLPLFWGLRRAPAFTKRGIPACSVCVVLVGGYWFVERVFGG
jgi:hydrogenase/urease accessory protein HupE